MPYNGSGQYEAPVNSWNPAVGGSTIDSADWNSTQSDYETALSSVITKDGQTTITANLPMSGFKHTGVNTNSGSTSRSEYVSGATNQDGAPLDAGDTAGTSTAYTATLTPAIAAYADKQCFRVKFNATCGNNPTINFNSVGAKKIYKNVTGTATQLVANDVYINKVSILRYDTALDSAAGGFWLLNEPGLPQSFSSITFDEGAAPSTPASGDVVIYAKTDGRMYSKDDAGTEIPMYGVSLPEVINASAFVSSASATATFTASAVLAKTSLTSIGYAGGAFSESVNLGTTGIGGMDTGSAPASGYVSIYAAYNPSTNDWGAFACAVATSTGEVYGGANAPSGYTATALLAIWPTNGSSQFIVAAIKKRVVSFASVVVLTGGNQTSYTTVSLTTACPAAAKSVSGFTNNEGGNDIWVAANTAGVGEQRIGYVPVSNSSGGSFFVPLTTDQQMAYKVSGGSGGRITVTGYEF